MKEEKDIMNQIKLILIVLTLSMFDCFDIECKKVYFIAILLGHIIYLRYMYKDFKKK